MTLFTELKRRNVFRVGFAYAVAAWILIQVTDTLVPMLELPGWIPKFIFLLLLVGLAPALIFAWAFEMTPEGIKRERDVEPNQSMTRVTGQKLNTAIISLLVLAVGYFIWESRFSNRGPGTAAVQQVDASGPSLTPASAPQPTARADRKSIAVLPFENRSRLEEDEFFVEGVHDDLLTNLARIGGLKVISRTSVSRYAGSEKSIPEIASELGVGTVMEGAVQRSGGMVRINVQLIDAQTDEHLWAEIFDRALTADNLFTIQSEISTEIARALSATLSPEEQRRVNDKPTENLEAYTAYLRGRQLMARRTSATLDQAEKEFMKAVELDANFALAWVAIAETAMLQTSYSTKDVVKARAQREEAVERALALNDQLGEAYLSQASIYEDKHLPVDAEAAFKRAIKLSPGYATAYHWYADFLSDFPHRLAEAGVLLKKALELDPMSSIIRMRMGGHLLQIGHLEQAEATTKDVLRLDPGFAPAYGVLANIASNKGQFDEELKWRAKVVETDPGNIRVWSQLMWAYMALGETAPFENLRQRIESIDDQHAALGWVDTFSTMYANQYPASLEHLDWIYQKTGTDPFMYRFKGYIHNHMRNYARARTAWEISDPEFFDRTRWREGIEDKATIGCLVADILRRTGDEEMGLALLQQATAYLENELPRYIDHADRMEIELCYLAFGDTDKAIEAIERRLEHGHGSAWFFMRKYPQFEALWGTPRFEAAWQKIQDSLVGQRERAAEITRDLGL